IFGQRVRGSDGAGVGTDDFSISNMGASANDAFDARFPDVATNTVNNRYLVVWEGEDATLNEFEIYGQQLDSTGGNIGADDFLISAMGPAGDTAYAASVPAVAYNPALNEYLIVWRGDHNAAPLQNDDFEIFGERLTAAGGVRENDFRISAMGVDGAATGAAEMPAVAYASSATNAYLAVWQGTDSPPSAETEIYGQLVGAQGDLEIVSKTVNKPGLVPGEAVSYVIAYRNNGPDAILGTQVTDTVPAAITGVSFASSPAVIAISGPPNYVFNTGTLAAGASGTITINGTVSSGAPTGSVVANTASISSTTLYHDPNGANNSKTVNFTVVEPALLIDKTLQTSSAGVDAFDTVDYRITVTHAGGGAADAHNLNVTDDMPAALQGTSIVSALVTDGVNSRNVAGALTINGSGDLVTIGDIDLFINTNGTTDETLTITLRGTVRNTVSPGGTIANAATVTWQDSLGTQRAGYTATDLAATISVPSVFSVTKTITPATSVVGVGDTLTYQLATTVIEGTTTNLQWVDTLPAGLSYVPGSLNVAGAGGMTVNGLGVSLAGQVLTIEASSVVNPGNADNAAAADSDVFYVTYQATVNPSPSGTVLANDVDASADPGLSDTNNSVSVTVIEPELTLSKTLVTSGAGADAGDTVRYRIVVAPTATSGANANNLIISDTLPAQLHNLALVSAIVSDGATSTNVSGAFAISAGVLHSDGTVDLLLNTNGAQDQALTVVVQGTLRDSVAPAATIANSATVTWENGAGQRRPLYTATDAAPAITVPTVFSLAKTLDPPATAVNVGQELTYNLTTTLIEGTTSNVQWVDTLPAGLTYVPGSAVVSNANGMTVNGLGVSLAGQTLTISATSVVNPGNVNNAAAADSDSFVIAYRVTVDPVASGTVLANDVDASADPGLSDTDNSVSVTVAEPELTLSKTLVTSGAGVDAGDAVRYQIRISHTAGSASNANNLIISDTLPTQLHNLGLVSAIVSDGATSTNVSGAFAISAGALHSDGTVDLLLNTNGAQDQALTVVVQGTLRDSVTPAATIANTATVTWENVAGLRNPSYAASGSAPAISVPGSLAVTKSVVGGLSQVAIGQVFSYELSTALIEGTTNNLRWVDTLPAGLRYVPGSAAVSDANGMTVSGFGATLAGQTLTISVTSVVNPGASNNPANPDLDSFTIRYAVVVEDSASAGAVLTNSVDASADDLPPDNGNTA
ncbi:MAG TPA: isopeptide-forming domain-containing fimbrial protein, partial [Herpetosiphonaceae bacterium]|nr:isopeptide-forming domain-containing fimbrial protein [Herpetosiphonaceae bacterium]